jgi:hypothetical protein
MSIKVDQSGVNTDSRRDGTSDIGRRRRPTRTGHARIVENTGESRDESPDGCRGTRGDDVRGDDASSAAAQCCARHAPASDAQRRMTGDL